MKDVVMCEVCGQIFEDEAECVKHEEAHGECFVVIGRDGKPNRANTVLIHAPGFCLRILQAKKLAMDVAMGDYDSTTVKGSQCSPKPKFTAQESETAGT